MTTSKPSPRPQPLRAALLGLALGCGLGGLALLASGTHAALTVRDCADLECGLRQQVRRERAPYQLGFGGALCLLGIGLGLLRAEGPADPE